MGERNRGKQKAANAVKHDGSLLRLVDRFSDYSGRFVLRVCREAARLCSVTRSLSVSFLSTTLYWAQSRDGWAQKPGCID